MYKKSAFQGCLCVHIRYVPSFFLEQGQDLQPTLVIDPRLVVHLPRGDGGTGVGDYYSTVSTVIVGLMARVRHSVSVVFLALTKVPLDLYVAGMVLVPR